MVALMVRCGPPIVRNSVMYVLVGFFFFSYLPVMEIESREKERQSERRKEGRREESRRVGY